MKLIRSAFWNTYYLFVTPKTMSERMIKTFRCKGVEVTNIKLSKAAPEDFKGLPK